MILSSTNLNIFWFLVVFKVDYLSAIINGTRVKNITERSYMVQIWTKKDGFLHAGIILNERAVITVANRLKDYTDGRHDEVEVISAQISTRNKPGTRYCYKIYEVFLHPSYMRDFTFPLFDVAILKLRRPFEFSLQNVRLGPAPITKRITPTRFNCTMTGWGSTNASDPDQRNYDMYTGRIFTASWQLCRQINAPQVLCGVKHFHHVSTCKGDEGGPLICFWPKVDKHPFVHALIWSCRLKCDEGPEVFIPLFFHKLWISITLRVMKTDKMYKLSPKKPRPR